MGKLGNPGQGTINDTREMRTRKEIGPEVVFPWRLDISVLTETWWSVQHHSAGRDPPRHRCRHDVSVGSRLRPPGPGCEEHPGQQQSGLQGFRLWSVSGAGGRPRCRLHNHCEFKKKSIKSHNLFIMQCFKLLLTLACGCMYYGNTFYRSCMACEHIHKMYP